MTRRECLAAGLGFLPQTDTANWTLAPGEYGKVLKTSDGRSVFEYMTVKPEKTNLAANSVCCFHPANTPSGERVTDLAPGDHHHHRGIFLAWHSMEFHDKADFSALGPTRPPRGFNINRADFWGWGQYAPTQGRVIRNRSVELAGADVRIANQWTIDNKVFAVEDTTVRVREEDQAFVLALAYRLTPAFETILNQTSFGGFCVRARNDGESWYTSPKGKVMLPDPHYSMPDLNWPAEPWYDFSIRLKNGKTVGAAVVDHPENPRATWHNPRYVWMINPCILAGGPVRLEAGKPLLLRYRVILHDGPTPAALLNRLAKEV